MAVRGGVQLGDVATSSMSKNLPKAVPLAAHEHGQQPTEHGQLEGCQIRASLQLSGTRVPGRNFLPLDFTLWGEMSSGTHEFLGKVANAAHEHGYVGEVSRNFQKFSESWGGGRPPPAQDEAGVS